jgi:hypothetical protein
MKNMIIVSLFSLTVAGMTVPADAAPLAPTQSLGMGSSELLQEAANRSNNYNNYNTNNHYQSNNNNYQNNNHHRMRQSWDGNRDGSRCRYRSSNCNHYHNGYWYANPWWALPLIGGSIILNSQNYNSGSRHVAWCEDHYRSYNPRTNTWIAYGGDERECMSPYGS